MLILTTLVSYSWLVQYEGINKHLVRDENKCASLIELPGPPLELSQSRNYKTIQQILYRMNRMCVQVTNLQELFVIEKQPM